MTFRKKIIANVLSGKTRGGFSLVELLIAVLIMTISFMAVLPLLWNTVHVNKATELSIKARDFATQKVEDLMVRSRDEVDVILNGSNEFKSETDTRTGFKDEYLSLKGEILPSATDANRVFTRTWSVVQVPGVTADPKPVIYSCVVTFNYKGQTRSRSFSTMWSF